MLPPSNPKLLTSGSIHYLIFILAEFNCMISHWISANKKCTHVTKGITLKH